MDRWEVKLYERKRNPDLSSKPRKVGRKLVPEDTIPRSVSGFFVMASGPDMARQQVKDHLRRAKRQVCSVNVAAGKRRTLIVHAFEKGKPS